VGIITALRVTDALNGGIITALRVTDALNGGIITALKVIIIKCMEVK